MFPNEILVCYHMFCKVSCFPPSTWHISFRAHYAVFVFCLWMWKNYMQFHIQSLLIVRCRMLSICGCTTTLTEIPNKGHGQQSLELDTAHWNAVVFLATFHTGCIHLLLKPPYPRIIISAPISVSSEGNGMLPHTILQYPFCPCSPCNLQLQLASP